MCAVSHVGTGAVIFPFLLRDLSSEAFCPTSATRAKDIVSPYGYGGAFCWDEGVSAGDEFWRSFTEWANDVGVVSEFVRLTLFEHSTVPYPGVTHVQQLNVVRSLDLDEAGLWRDVEHKVRKNVNRARSSRVQIEMDATGSRIDDFLSIYEETMGRRHAARAYYFPRSFFDVIHASLPGQFAYFHATLDGVVISTELVLISADHVYSFLGGTSSAAFDVRPNDVLKYEVMLWARRHGKRAFVLGGGYSAGDGIFQYKKSFAPNGLMPFSIGRRVLNPRMYEELVTTRAALAGQTAQTWSSATSYFPAYRA
jgi:hypothetical protein